MFRKINFKNLPSETLQKGKSNKLYFISMCYFKITMSSMTMVLLLLGGSQCILCPQSCWYSLYCRWLCNHLRPSMGLGGYKIQGNSMLVGMKVPPTTTQTFYRKFWDGPFLHHILNKAYGDRELLSSLLGILPIHSYMVNGWQWAGSLLPTHDLTSKWEASLPEHKCASVGHWEEWSGNEEHINILCCLDTVSIIIR